MYLGGVRTLVESHSNFWNTVIYVISGFLFSTGWWIIIDSALRYNAEQLPHAMHAIGSVATVGFLLLNIIPRQSLVEVDDVNACLKTYLFFAMLVNFASLIAACWVLFGTYVTGAITPVYPGVAILLQTLLIVSSSFLYRFGPRNESY